MKYKQTKHQLNRAIRRLQRSVTEWEKSVIAKILEVPAAADPAAGYAGIQFATMPERTAPGLMAAVRNEYTEQAREAVRQIYPIYKKLEKRKAADFADDAAKAAYFAKLKQITEEFFTLERDRLMVNIALEVQDAILAKVSEMMGEGKSIFQIQQEIAAYLPDDGSLNGFFGTIYRAERIARTEAAVARQKTQFDAIRTLGMKGKKTWIAELDPRRTRASHLDMHGQTRDINEPYEHEATGYLVMFPCDPSLNAGKEFLIQCRCTQTYDLEL